MGDPFHSPSIDHLFTLGYRDCGIIRRLIMSGNRECYGWDSYGFGPCGCETFLWIDRTTHRLLTTCMTLYGDGCHNDITHSPREWDLETDELVVQHEDEYYDYRCEDREIPKVFKNRSISKRPLRNAQTIVDTLPPVFFHERLITCEISWKSLNSSDIVILGRYYESENIPNNKGGLRFFIYNPETGDLYSSSFLDANIRIRTVVRLSSGMVAYGIDTEKNVCKISLNPKEDLSYVPPVLRISLPKIPGPYALQLLDGIEIHTREDGSRIRKFIHDDLIPYPNNIDIEGLTSGLLQTPDEEWVLCDSEKMNRCLVPGDRFLIILNDIINFA